MDNPLLSSSFKLNYFELSIAEYQQNNVLNSSMKWRNLAHCQDLLIYTAMCH